jgi:hypothetical protein
MDWNNSVEKNILKNDIMARRVTDLTPPLDAYNMNDGILHKFDYNSFRAHFKNLKDSIRADDKHVMKKRKHQIGSIVTKRKSSKVTFLLE